MPAVTASQNTGVQLALVVQKLDDLIGRFEGLTRQFEQFVAGRGILDNRLSIVETSLSAVCKTVAEHEQEITKLTQVILDLGFTNRVLKWILVIMTSIGIPLLLGLLGFGIALLTGQAVIVRP
jgi:hypothetical protein